MINLLSGCCGCGSIVTAFYLLIPDTSAVEKFERFEKAFECFVKEFEIHRAKLVVVK